jgi:hypothetical protein
VEPLTALHSNGRLVTLPTNMVAVTNTLAYDDMELITGVKSFMLQYPGSVCFSASVRTTTSSVA